MKQKDHKTAQVLDLGSSVLESWRTNCRVTSALVKGLPTPLWDESVPEYSRKTIRMVLAHLHNARAGWIRTLGRPHGIEVPPSVNRHRVDRRELLAALKHSGDCMEALLQFGLETGNQVPPTPAYVWRNLALDVGHILTYFVAHEAHHRGQIVMIARQLGHRLPRSVIDGLWQWKVPPAKVSMRPAVRGR